MVDKPALERWVSLFTIAREWTRLGCIGFGGPPAHIVLLRRLCVDKRRWMDDGEFEDGVAVANLLPGPASTQLSIYCAWRLRGAAGAIIGGVCFIIPGIDAHPRALSSVSRSSRASVGTRHRGRRGRGYSSGRVEGCVDTRAREPERTCPRHGGRDRAG